MEYFKFQLGCLMVITYIAFIYLEEKRRFKKKRGFRVFDALLAIGIVEVIFDGLTSYTVNHLETVSAAINQGLHLVFLLSLDSFIFCLFVYMLSITTGLPKEKWKRVIFICPIIINLFMVLAYIDELQYRTGDLSNYSMGMSAYTCFATAGIYILFSFLVFFRRWRHIEKHKRMSIFTYLFALTCITCYQMLYPQSLLSSVCVAIIIVGAYVNHENPSVTQLEAYHDEMIMGFATLVENKDGSTGGHIKRTTKYVKLLAEELRRRGLERKTLTKDYLKNLYMAAPMHDIGKISVPDVVLQKPGKLTEEEFAIMKQHTVNGGKIIQETFAHLENDQYTELAYQVAMYHHEKWNGKGYPEGLQGEEIPLCARIMAIADVFDAVSEKRCYREAMPLDKCFSIIEEGRGRDFDPVLVDIFLDIRDKVEEVHSDF